MPTSSFVTHVLYLVPLLCGLVTGNQFDPYQLNGGLVAAVAGKDYVLVATDTRLVGASGYDILERQHLRSRLWSVHSPPSWAQGEILIETNDKVASSQSPQLFEADGSLKFPEFRTTSTAFVPSTLIASSGCQADCEILKRTIRSEVRRLRHGGEVPLHTSPTSMAVLLSQTLYARRTFPWYAFCVVAGLASKENSTGDDVGGQVFVYDAIGSYEAVAVATAGNGRTLLQPILDRSFSNLDTTTNSASCYDQGGIVVAPYPRVQETAQQAAAILTKAYRAVSERDASVGDHVVLCCIQRGVNEDGKSISTCWSTSSSLKKH